MEKIVALRAEPEELGHDAGPATIAYHLTQKIKDPPSRTTIWRILQREGLIKAQPQKRPICWLKRFQADVPNELWQADGHGLAFGLRRSCRDPQPDRKSLAPVHALRGLLEGQAADVVRCFYAAQLHGLPFSLLSDNAAVFTCSPRRGKVLLESQLERLGVIFKNSRPYHHRPAARLSACTRPSPKLRTPATRPRRPGR